MGAVIDPSSDQATLPPGARLDLPLWMVPPMAGRNMVQVRALSGRAGPAVVIANACGGVADVRRGQGSPTRSTALAHMHGACPPLLPTQVDLPVFYGNKMRRKMKAGAGCEDLRVRCPHYYSVATRLHAAMQASEGGRAGRVS